VLYALRRPEQQFIDKHQHVRRTIKLHAQSVRQWFGVHSTAAVDTAGSSSIKQGEVSHQFILISR
jgi:hypothetical protein